MNSHLIYFNCFHVIFLLRNRRRMLSKLWSVFVLFVGMETFLTELIMPDLLYITRVPFDQCWRHRWSRFTKVGKTQLNHLCRHKALNPANLSLLGVQKWSMISVSPMKPPPPPQNRSRRENTTKNGNTAAAHTGEIWHPGGFLVLNKFVYSCGGSVCELLVKLEF